MGLFDSLKNKEREQTVSFDEALSKLNRPSINNLEENSAKYSLSRKAEMKELQEMIHLHENPNNRHFDAKRQL